MLFCLFLRIREDFAFKFRFLGIEHQNFEFQVKILQKQNRTPRTEVGILQLKSELWETKV